MRECKGCGGEIPPTRSACARFCTGLCRQRTWQRQNPEPSLAWKRRNPEKYRELHRVSEKQRRQLQTYGRILGDNPLAHTKDRYRHARAEGYRSGLEVAAANQLTALGVEFQYEVLRIPYAVEETRHYVPDFILPNGIILELKGRWLTPDRKRHRLLHAQYPEIDFRYIFSRPQERISKQSRTTYQKFCESQGWKCAGPTVPVEWTRERANVRSLRAIERLLAG